MLFHLTYQQALKQPTAKGGRGWKYAGPVSMQAAMAQALGVQHCLNGKAIYDWANRHYVHLWQERKRLQAPDLLLVAVLNDWDLERTEKELKD